MTDFCKTLPTLQRTWSASSLRLLMECPRKYWYRKIRGIRPVQPQDDLDFGSFLHIGMEAYDNRVVDGVKHDDAVLYALRIMLHAAGTYATYCQCTDCDMCWEKGCEIQGPGDEKGYCPRCGIDLAETVPTETPPSWTPWNPENKKKNRRTLVRALVWTLDEFEKGHIRPHADADGHAATEVDFAVPLPFNSPDGEPYLLTGIIDSFCEIGGPDQVMPRERKTTNSTLGRAYFDRFEFDIQIDVYSLAMRIMSEDEITPGVVLEAIQTGVTFSRARRQVIQSSNDQLEEFVETIQHWIGEAAIFARLAHLFPEKAMEVYPMNRSNCNNFRKEDVEDNMYSSIVHGGCPYRELCTKDRSVRERYEKGSYEEVEG